jgi:hypothetical protein
MLERLMQLMPPAQTSPAPTSPGQSATSHASLDSLGGHYAGDMSRIGPAAGHRRATVPLPSMEQPDYSDLAGEGAQPESDFWTAVQDNEFAIDDAVDHQLTPEEILQWAVRSPMAQSLVGYLRQDSNFAADTDVPLALGNGSTPTSQIYTGAEKDHYSLAVPDEQVHDL